MILSSRAGLALSTGFPSLPTKKLEKACDTCTLFPPQTLRFSTCIIWFSDMEIMQFCATSFPLPGLNNSWTPSYAIKGYACNLDVWKMCFPFCRYTLLFLIKGCFLGLKLQATVSQPKHIAETVWLSTTVMVHHLRQFLTRVKMTETEKWVQMKRALLEWKKKKKVKKAFFCIPFDFFIKVVLWGRLKTLSKDEYVVTKSRLNWWTTSG